MKYSRILTAYDGSNESKKALQHALNLASPETLIDVIHAYQHPRFIMGEAYIAVTPAVEKMYYSQAEGCVEEAKKIVSSHSNANVELVEGPPADAILQYAKEKEADLIVIGSRGLGGLKELFLGSVSHGVVQRSEIPVLIVK